MTRVAVFSDIHGNLPALEAFVKHISRDVDRYICLGDIVNYGPWNDECVELVFSLPGIVVLEGNHERLFLGLDDIQEEIALVQEFYHHSVPSFTRYDLIRDLPVQHVIGGFTCTHTIEDKRIYAHTDIAIDRNYLIGHTHHGFDIIRTGHRLINCGSIGQNRRDLSRLSYAVIDLRDNSTTLHERSYDAGPLIAEMERRNYGPNCLGYYRSKLQPRSPQSEAASTYGS